MVANVSVAAALTVTRSVRVKMLVFLVAIVITSFGWLGVVSYVGVEGPAPPAKPKQTRHAT